jgi:hypothetical protein
LTLPRYVIEREIPGAGKLSPQELQAIAQKSCSVLDQLGPKIQQLVREHARQGGFPANSVAEVKSIIDPTTAEA